MDLHILIIEDDEAIYEGIKERFEQWGVTVSKPNSFKEVMDTFHDEKPNLVMIDIQLPAYDGFHWCREIRQVSTVPIIFLSSRDHPMDMVMAMQLGADDFVQKPFHMDVLLAKMQALVRRVYDYGYTQSDMQRWNGASISFSKSIVQYDEKAVELTKNELFILRVLLRQVDQIVPREELMRQLWNDERFVNDNTLSVNVNRLRSRLEEIGLVNVIETKKGIGYRAVTK